MKGIRFYEEYTDAKTRKQPAGTIVAIETEYYSLQNLGDRMGLVYEGYAAVFSHANSPVCSTGVGADYLRDYCKHVSEARARKVHPRLFEYLEEVNNVA